MTPPSHGDPCALGVFCGNGSYWLVLLGRSVKKAVLLRGVRGVDPPGKNGWLNGLDPPNVLVVYD